VECTTASFYFRFLSGLFLLQIRANGDYVVFEYLSDERQRNYVVSLAKKACSCLRYFDEGIPCKHIICVGQHSNMTYSELKSLIIDLYEESRFAKAFLQKESGSFIPDSPLCYPPVKGVIPRTDEKRCLVVQAEKGDEEEEKRQVSPTDV